MLICKIKKRIRSILHKLKATSCGVAKGLYFATRSAIHRVTSAEELVYITLTEHIGDIVACEPIIDYVQKTYKNPKIIWTCRQPYTELLKYHPKINRIIAIHCLSEWLLIRFFVSPFSHIVDLHIEGRHCGTCGWKLTKVANNKAITLANYFSYGPLLVSFAKESNIDVPLDAAPQLYLDPSAEIYRPSHAFIVLHRKSNEEVKDWPTNKWQQFAEHILATTDLTIVDIGANHPPLDLSKERYCCLIGKTTLQQTAKTIKAASFFVGIDSGMAHIANCFKVPSLILLGKYARFDSYMPYTGFLRNEEFMLRTVLQVKELEVLSLIERFDDLKGKYILNG